MKVVDPGHRFVLRSLDGGGDQTLTFVKRDTPPETYPGNVGHHGGTTIQEVLRALIARAEYVNDQIPYVWRYRPHACRHRAARKACGPAPRPTARAMEWTDRRCAGLRAVWSHPMRRPPMMSREELVDRLLAAEAPKRAMVDRLLEAEGPKREMLDRLLEAAHRARIEPPVAPATPA